MEWKKFPSMYARTGGEIVWVGGACKMPAGDPGHHTSVGRVADSLLQPVTKEEARNSDEADDTWELWMP